MLFKLKKLHNIKFQGKILMYTEYEVGSHDRFQDTAHYPGFRLQILRKTTKLMPGSQ
jgi:hypothetical protein